MTDAKLQALAKAAYVQARERGEVDYSEDGVPLAIAQLHRLISEATAEDLAPVTMGALDLLECCCPGQWLERSALLPSDFSDLWRPITSWTRLELCAQLHHHAARAHLHWLRAESVQFQEHLIRLVRLSTTRGLSNILSA